MKKIEVLFDQLNGKFVVHFDGVPTHDEEHQILDELIARLKKKGYAVEVEHRHDDPKLPQQGGGGRNRNPKKREGR
ncbi:MAG: hypothetical protein G01um101419_163 [Parcubacteria group bacterium Gr01-1014_19]|nr:MAG: hypothetical protein G01um101419_163 [Parcubacteria group bacterium Gr01-1014_19]